MPLGKYTNIMKGMPLLHAMFRDSLLESVTFKYRYEDETKSLCYNLMECFPRRMNKLCKDGL